MIDKNGLVPNWLGPPHLIYRVLQLDFTKHNIILIPCFYVFFYIKERERIREALDSKDCNISRLMKWWLQSFVAWSVICNC